MTTTIQLIIYLIVTIVLILIFKHEGKLHNWSENEMVGSLLVAVTWPVSIPFFILLGGIAFISHGIYQGLKWLTCKIMK